MTLERATTRVDEDALNQDDDDLVEAARGGDEAAFAALVERYSSRIWTLVIGMVRDRMAAEDVLQEVFFKVHRKLPTFEGKSRFYTWLYRVAFNTATDHLKKRRLDRSRSEGDLSPFESEGAPPPEKTLKDEELRKKLAEAVAALPPKYRDILVLREYEDCSYEEIAVLLRCSKGTVESRLFRARARLREKLKGWTP